MAEKRGLSGKTRVGLIDTPAFFEHGWVRVV